MPVVDIKAKEGIVEKEKQDSFSKEMVALIADLLKTETDQVVLNLLLIAAGTNDMHIEISAFDSEERRAHPRREWSACQSDELELFQTVISLTPNSRQLRRCQGPAVLRTFTTLTAPRTLARWFVFGRIFVKDSVILQFQKE